MAYLIAFVLIAWIVLICNKVTHVGAYLAATLVGLLVGFIMSMISSVLVEKTEWVETWQGEAYGVEWQPKGNQIQVSCYVKGSNGSLLHRTFTMDEFKVDDSHSNPWYVKYDEKLINDRTYFWLGLGFVKVPDPGQQRRGEYREVKFPSSMAKKFADSITKESK